jgi:hypothetical protein
MHSLLANLAQAPSRPPRVLAVDVARGSARTVSRTRIFSRLVPEKIE